MSLVGLVDYAWVKRRKGGLREGQSASLEETICRLFKDTARDITYSSVSKWKISEKLFFKYRVKKGVSLLESKDSVDKLVKTRWILARCLHHVLGQDMMRSEGREVVLWVGAIGCDGSL